MSNSLHAWTPALVDDGDYVKCKSCGFPHQLTQGKLGELRVGDGLLFYKCGDNTYIGAINRVTAFGVEYVETKRGLDTDVQGDQVLPD